VAAAPEMSPTTIPIDTTSESCAGAAASYLLRSIALCAGRFAPGIQERVFIHLPTRSYGSSLGAVERWFGEHEAELTRLGYRFGMRRVAFPTPALIEWVVRGQGFRGVVLHTDGGRLHPGHRVGDRHAVAVIAGARRSKPLVIDPVPAAENPGKPSPLLERAHRACQFGALALFWYGWS